MDAVGAVDYLAVGVAGRGLGELGGAVVVQVWHVGGEGLVGAHGLATSR